MGVRGPISKARPRAAQTSKGVRLRALPTESVAIFKRLARDIDGLSPADVALLELLAYWIEIAKECRAQLAAPVVVATNATEDATALTLTVVDTTHGDGKEGRRNPLLIVLRTATEQIRALAQQLGASPMARARLPVNDDDGEMGFGEQFFQAAAEALKAKKKADGI